ncbi:MAG: putative dehydrogenase [Candidatus Binatia bacterium]|jgi:predicted dehydrogenase
MNSPFRIAFLGIDNPHGAGWRETLANFGDEIEITAIVPGFGGATTSLEERHSRAPRFETVDDLIARGEFDGAVVALPNNEAPAAAAKLARAGKHVLVEKPMAGCANDARPMIEAVSGSGVAFQSGFMWRYDEAAERLRDMVADGRFGKLISLELTFVTSDVNRRGPNHYLFDPDISGGGFFNWLACHYLDLLFFVTGQRIVGVTARTGAFGATDVEVEDGGVAILDLSGGGIATFVGGYWLPRWAGEAHWTIRGSERWVHWEPGRAGTGGAFEIHGPQPQWNAMDETFELPVDNTPGYGGKRTVKAIRDWLDAAKEDGRPCRNTPQTLVETLSLVDAIYESSRTGRRVECDIGGRE